MSDLFDKQHLEELEGSLFTKMSVKTEAYNKSLLICESLKTIPSSLFETFVEDCHEHFKEIKRIRENLLAQLKVDSELYKFLKEGGNLYKYLKIIKKGGNL